MQEPDIEKVIQLEKKKDFAFPPLDLQNEKQDDFGELGDALPPLPPVPTTPTRRATNPHSGPPSPAKSAFRQPGSRRPTGPHRPGTAMTVTLPELEQSNTLGTAGTARTMPPLKRRETKLAQKETHPWQHLGITLGGPMIILFDLVVPLAIYYAWRHTSGNNWRAQCQREHPNQNPCPIARPEFDKDILGGSVASFGIGELWILVARVWRLWFQHDECAPLISKNKWELDATSWVYAVAMIIALIPFVVGSSLVIPELYLYGPSFIMGFLLLLMIVTTLMPFNIPIGINSQQRGTRLRPFIYYAAEDFMAVDGLQDREFRQRYNDRYDTNPMFRKFFFRLTLWWMLGASIYIGSMSAVIWTGTPFHIAFGLMLGILFGYIAIWAFTTYLFIKWEMTREHIAYEKGEI